MDSGISSRNSEVIHAGIYYPPKTLKAELCVKGRQMLYEYCSSRNIEVNQCGKLVVATNENQMHNELMKILRRGQENGVSGLSLISNEDVKVMEPNVNCFGALWSPETGIVDSHSFMLALLAEAEENGAVLALHSKVNKLSIDEQTTRIRIETDGVDLLCKNVINATGLFAAQISLEEGQGNKMQHYFAKGNYFRLEGETSPFSRLIYPVPEPGGLGIHATIDLNGYCKFGPDVEWVDTETINPDEIELKVNTERASSFYSAIRKYWPELKDGSLSPDCKFCIFIGS